MTLAGWMLAAAALAGYWSLHVRLRARAALVAQAVHELRGPLCAARLALDGPLSGRIAEAGWPRRAAAIELELRRAALALDDLGAAGRGKRAGDLIEDVDVRALARDAVDAWRALARAAGGAVALDAPAEAVSVLADPIRLAQATGNLVANAVEHGGGRVRVRVRRLGASARIEVSDRGPGLPAPVADLLRAAAGGRARRGHGLTIAARIAAAHGGRLTTAPTARGACLVLELPALPPAGATRSTGAKEP